MTSVDALGAHLLRGFRTERNRVSEASSLGLLDPVIVGKRKVSCLSTYHLGLVFKFLGIFREVHGLVLEAISIYTETGEYVGPNWLNLYTK